MTVAGLYLIIGAVVWTFVFVLGMSRCGWKYFKTYYNPIWILFTDMFVSILSWPVIVFSLCTRWEPGMDFNNED